MLIKDKDKVKAFVLGGNAIFTISNTDTGNRYTYKVVQKKGGDIFWVKLLNGPDNTTNYRFFGTIFPGGKWKHSALGKISTTAKSAMAWAWFLERLFSAKSFPSQFEFHHAGRCCRCCRLLTDPESIARGVGPECATKMAA